MDFLVCFFIAASMIDRHTEHSFFCLLRVGISFITQLFIFFLSHRLFLSSTSLFLFPFLSPSLPPSLPPSLSLSQVICGQCANVSEREEDFLDIPVALTGRAGLEAALKEMFCDIEILDGSNQYRCERCQCLVDAKRVS